MAQSGDVYRLDRQFADHLYLHRNGKRCDAGNALFSAAISGWLWVTVLFANFAEALAEGRSKAQANSLKGVKKLPLPASCVSRNMALRRTKFPPINCVKAISYW